MDSSSTPESKESTAPSEEQPAESSSVPESQSEPVENVDSEPEVIPLAAGLKADPSASLLKTVSNDEVQIEQPEEGAQFQIYLASAGSYENAKETERDLLTTDSYGFARSKDLPYGLYVVHQTKGAEGQKFVPDFSVFISEHGKTYYFILNNPTFTSLIRFEKKDAESGKIIPLAGTAVKIRNTDTGEWVVQHINYPSPIDIDTFVTDATGTLMLPEPLPFGNYELYEQQSPWGYVLDKEPVPFVVDGSQDVVTVEKYNIPQKGTITVSKEGEVFSHVAESGGMYQPQYEVQGQPGAVYEITALEDVITPDGTVRLKAGELAATLTTGSDGTATSEPLYLSRYQVKEITAPDGMVIDPEPKEVVLSYAGQEVEITSASVGFVNERQKVEISLKKLLEQDEIFSLGMNEEWKNITFGLFAAEQLTASDGTSIPADGLMETIGIDENGNAVFKTDIPCGASLYVQEIGTDDHYILSDKKYPVVFEYAGQDVAKVEIEVNDGEAIENTLKRGKVSGWKVDQDGFELGGAVIGLFRFDETEFTEETALMVTESNEIGYFEFDKVPVGNFLVREIAAPKAFAQHTNVDTKARIIAYDIRELGEQLMPIGMLVTLDAIFNRVIQNWKKGKTTWVFADEFYLLFRYQYSADFFYKLWKRIRKYNGLVTGLTQNVEELLRSDTARLMLANSEFLLLLNQSSTDRDELANLLHISDTQLGYITNVAAGCGLIRCAGNIVPFENSFPRNTRLYQLMTTKPDEALRGV